MTVSIVQLGLAAGAGRRSSDRNGSDGLRVGCPRRITLLGTSTTSGCLPCRRCANLVAQGKSAVDSASWRGFRRKFRTEMNQPDAARILDLLAALSHRANLSVGCYCEDESHCHRGVLRELLVERGARVA